MKIEFSNSYSKLPERFYQRVSPADFKQPKLLSFNYPLASELGINTEGVSEDELALIFSGQKILPGSEPIATVYAAHQFGHFVANEVLPDYVGGSKVHLLLGIKLSVQPVHLFTLESGISVFRSPFKDIFGSDICYGGSHQSFKESKTSPQKYHAALFLNDEESASMSVFQATCDTEKVRDEMFTSVLDYVKDNDSMISTTIMVEPEACFNVFPSALGEEELKEAKENIVEYSNDDSQELHQGCVNSMNDIQSLSPDLYQEEYIKEGSEAYWDYAIKDFIVAQYEPEEHLNSSNASIFLPQACRGRRSKRKRKGSSGPATLLTLQS